MNIPIKFLDLGFPTNFSGTFEQFRDACAQYLGGEIGDNRLILGQVGGIKPISNIGPWLNTAIWYYFNSVVSDYVPADIAIGNKNFSVVLFADPSQPQIIFVPDRDGTMALLEDIYEPRQTVDLSTLTPMVDWSKSAVFRYRMPGGGDATIGMSNSLPGQEIYIAIINIDSSKVKWPTSINWETTTPPVQTVAAATTETFTDGISTNAKTLIISSTAKFKASDVGKTIKEPTGTAVIPASTTISSVAADGTSAVMSAAANSSSSKFTFQIVGRSTSAKADVYRIKNIGGTLYGQQFANYSGTIPSEAVSDSRPAAPVFNPPAAHYTGNSGTLTTTISAVDTRANRIKYTLDGSDPSLVNGTTITSLVNGKVSGLITITGATPTNNKTVKAISIDAFDQISTITAGVFYNDYDPTVVIPDPTASVSNGTYTTFPTTMPVTLTAFSPGTRLRYTTDGSTPNFSTGTLINATSGTIQIPQGTTTLKFVAIDNVSHVSNVISRTYTVAYPAVPVPTFSPGGGTYTTYPGYLPVTLAVASPAVAMIYTVNGSTPTIGAAGTFNLGAQQYTVGMAQGTTTLKVRGRDANNNLSATATAIFVNNYSPPPPPTVPNPTLSPSSGDMPVNVAVACVSPAVKMRYTTDGTTPNLTTGTLINGTSASIPMSGTHSKTLKVVAITADNRLSGIATGTYDPAGGNL